MGECKDNHENNQEIEIERQVVRGEMSGRESVRGMVRGNNNEQMNNNNNDNYYKQMNSNNEQINNVNEEPLSNALYGLRKMSEDHAIVLDSLSALAINVYKSHNVSSSV